jgi:hypothetical protein
VAFANTGFEHGVDEVEIEAGPSRVLVRAAPVLRRSVSAGEPFVD